MNPQGSLPKGFFFCVKALFRFRSLSERVRYISQKNEKNLPIYMVKPEKQCYREAEVYELQIAIVDDEKEIREQIKGLIEKQMAEWEPEVYGTGEELLSSGKHFDIIFLDIQMDGKNGIETARELRERGEEAILIFITGIREYVFEAFDVAAFHYLVKPIAENRFAEILERAVKEAENRMAGAQRQLFCKTRNRNYTLNPRDILYVENRKRKVEIHTAEEVIEIYAAMKELEKQLGEDFYRCHRGYLVNMAHITEYDNDGIRLSNGERVYLSRERYSEFVKGYMRYLRKEGGICV